MNELSRRGGRRAVYLLHRSLGLATVVLTTVVLFTGAFTVFAYEFRSWALRDRLDPTLTSLRDIEATKLDATIASALALYEPPVEATIWLEPGTRLELQLEHETEGHLEVRELDPRAEQVGPPRVVTPEALREPTYRESAKAFFDELHERLHLRFYLGRFVTGLLGVLLLVSAWTGLVTHWPRRSTLLQLPSGRLRQKLGALHTLLGGWALLFLTLTGVSGVYLSWFMVTQTAVYGSAFDANVEAARAVLEPPIVVEARPDPPRERPVSLAALVADAHDRSGGEVPVTSIKVSGWGSPRSYALVGVYDIHRKPTQMRFLYHGDTGEYLSRWGRVGGPPSFGSRAIQWVRALHYGNIDGAWTKILWVLFGIAACAVTASGLLVWERRLSSDEVALKKLARACIGVLAALPLASAVALYAWGVLTPWPPFASMGLAFSASLAVAGWLALRFRLRCALSWLLGVAGVAFAGLPGLGYAVTGVAPFASVSQPFLDEAALVDLGFLFSAAVLLSASAALALSARRDRFERLT